MSDELISEIKENLPELPAARKLKYMTEWGLEAEQAEILVEQREKGDWMDRLAQELGIKNQELSKECVKWFIGDISGLLEAKGIAFAELPVQPADLIYLVTALNQNKISGTIIKKVLEEMFANGGKAEGIIQSQGLEQITDDGAITKVVAEVIAANQKLVDSLAKNPNAINALVGQVMKATRGQANPKAAEAALRTALADKL